jgi:hypothetical protein
LGGFRVRDCECKSASGLSKEHSDRQWGVGRFAGLGSIPRAS